MVVTTLSLSRCIKSIFLTLLFCLPLEARIILLNGTSSAGKSSVIREFVKLNPQYMPLSIDNFMLDLYTKQARELGIISSREQITYIEQVREYINNRKPAELRPQLHAHFNQLAEHIFELFYDDVALKAKKNKNIIIDDVITMNDELENFFNKMESFDVVMMLAYCPFSKLPAHVEKRNKSGDKAEYRTLDSVLCQFSYVYEPTTEKDFIKIPTAEFDQTVAYAQRTLHPYAYQAMKSEIDRKLAPAFSYDQSTIYLKPRMKYDHVIHTGKNDPVKNAVSISAYIANHPQTTGFKRSKRKFLHTQQLKKAQTIYQN